MAKNKPGTVPPSISGVSGHDIFNCFSALWKIPEVQDIRFKMEDRQHNQLYMVCEVDYLFEGELWTCTSQDTWTPWGAPVQTHIYRCVFNAAIDVGRAMEGMVSLTSLPAEPSSPAPE